MPVKHFSLTLKKLGVNILLDFSSRQYSLYFPLKCKFSVFIFISPVAWSVLFLTFQLVKLAWSLNFKIAISPLFTSSNCFFPMFYSSLLCLIQFLRKIALYWESQEAWYIYISLSLASLAIKIYIQFFWLSMQVLIVLEKQGRVQSLSRISMWIY